MTKEKTSMSITEAIKHCKEIEESCKSGCEEQCGSQHKQLREWLEELIKLRRENKLI